ncbi:hypothetical protein GAGA_1015 [Paraglaciecola agarilytica NO2]|uniref:Uncharacterized protein n=1 Tax=Paraglaciecola agarilytica NO2 TaxID=1125747 RepID=A0ABQ0I3J7_9ALTE|nr:hypothetical protein GAGA_1015 [Paraglaciecola agarilytica NO2]
MRQLLSRYIEYAKRVRLICAGLTPELTVATASSGKWVLIYFVSCKPFCTAFCSPNTHLNLLQ